MKPLLTLLNTLLLTTPFLNAVPAAPDDAAWLKAKGAVLFSDTFDREEDGNGMKAIGNGWESATADRIPHIKQADLDEGILKIASASKEGGHPAHIHHDAGFQDGGVTLRFRFPGLNKGETLTLGFVDRELQNVHAGHLCYAILSSGNIVVRDNKTGVSDLAIQKRRTPYLTRKEPLPADLDALLKTKELNTPWKADNQWHELSLVTQGDELRLSVDGKIVARHRSEGFAHPMKRWFSILASNTVWIDDVKIWKVMDRQRQADAGRPSELGGVQRLSNGKEPSETVLSTPIPVPRLNGEWIQVYDPQTDTFPGPDSRRFKTGHRYDNWQVNDHAILKGPDERWHAFGITHPAVTAGEPDPHEAEWFLFHAAAPVGSLKQQCVKGRWQDQSKILPPQQRPNEVPAIHSPYIVKHDGKYWMFYGYSPIRYATSTDLWSWQPQGEVFRQDGSARDPSVLSHDGVFYMSYTTRQSILVRTSRDLLHWSEPTTVFTLAPGETGGPESPTLLALNGGFYLLWCRWDAKLSNVGDTYQDRSFVYYSETPLNFTNREPVAEIAGHAPELFQDEDGDWWISSAERPNRGISLASVRWEVPVK